MMILMKLSRLATSPAKPDHWIDMAGYAACGGECATKEEAAKVYDVKAQELFGNDAYLNFK